MKKLAHFLKIIGATEDEALDALISAFKPPQPGALKGAWKSNAAFGHAAPETEDIWRLLVKADFRCQNKICRSQLRLTIDHKDNDSKNHAIRNLQVLCHACNRAKRDSQKLPSSPVPRVQLKLYEAAVALQKKSKGKFPKDQDILKAASVSSMSGATYLMRYLRERTK